jgi:hypothetical protein
MSVYTPPPLSFECLNQSLWHLLCMSPDPISTAYVINPSHYPVCLYVYSLPLLGNGSVKIPLSLLGNGSTKTLTLQRIQMQQKKNYWARRFLCGPCRIKERRRLVLPITSFFTQNVLRSHFLKLRYKVMRNYVYRLINIFIPIITLYFIFPLDKGMFRG